VKSCRGSTRSRSDQRTVAAPDDRATAAARERVRAVLDKATRINLGVVLVPRPDEARLEARRIGTSAAVMAGRRALMEEATGAARSIVLESFARSGFSGTWAATEMSMSVAGPADRMAAAAAFEEAAMAAVVEDLDVDDETLDVLRVTAMELTGLGSLPVPGSLSSIASVATVRRPLQIVVVAAFVLAILAIVATASLGIGIVVLGLGASLAATLSRRSSSPAP
jgi:hypothetical protein